MMYPHTSSHQPSVACSAHLDRARIVMDTGLPQGGRISGWLTGGAALQPGPWRIHGRQWAGVLTKGPSVPGAVRTGDPYSRVQFCASWNPQPFTLLTPLPLPLRQRKVRVTSSLTVVMETWMLVRLPCQGLFSWSPPRAILWEMPTKLAVTQPHPQCLCVELGH
jgi:hypothetical protein